MPIIQITKIQLRRGAERDLPGAPVSTSPLALAPGLDPGEVAFTTDTGRLFVGHDPSVGNANYRRAEFPYENIEVLTENSVETLRRMVDALLRSYESGYFPPVTLLPNDPLAGNDWTTVTLPDPSTGGTVPFRLDLPGAPTLVAATVTYFVFRNGAPVRHGRLVIVHDGSAAEPTLIDEAAGLAVLGTGEEATDPLSVYGSIRFRAVVQGPAVDQYTVLQCRNLTGDTCRLVFRVERARL